ncbi:hypothetical protein CAP48_12270 [Advenella sp. S44]|uniref:hypothetical protein n=1 Tax=Advenella sp. S44 TaxID=1982755 RepID=UPI000C2A6118|nr:hypothetical protein [Advenella sp. S44]PJX23844.1 hypothetical protein CAP48_12270 [Advenella sp. S44]
MKAITTGAVVLSLAAITGCAMHGSDDRNRHHDRTTSGQDGSGYNRTDGTHRPGMDGTHRPGMDSRRDGNWNSNDKTNRDWQNRDNHSGGRNNSDWNDRK